MQRVWEGRFLGRPTIVKQRFSKKYRHPQLDVKLTVSRLKQAGFRRSPVPKLGRGTCASQARPSAHFVEFLGS